METYQKLQAWELMLKHFPRIFNKHFERPGQMHSLFVDGLCPMIMQMHKEKLIDFRTHLYLQSKIDMYSVSHRTKNSHGYMWIPGSTEGRLEFIKMNIKTLKEKV